MWSVGCGIDWMRFGSVLVWWSIVCRSMGIEYLGGWMKGWVVSVPGVFGIPGVEVAVLGGTAGTVKTLCVGGRIGGS